MSTLETFRLAAEARKRKKEEKKDPKFPTVQNMTMAEALSRAMQESPNSPMVPVIKDVEQAREPEKIKQREEEQFTQLKEQLKELGLMWFGTRIDLSTDRSYGHKRIPIEQIREKWTQALTCLRDKPSAQRIELLSAIASGMHLREDNFPTLDAKYGRIFPFTPLVYSSFSEPLGISFTRPSIFFMKSISGMSDHSIEQEKEFREFMVRKAGLTGKVELPEIFSGISRWIDYSGSRVS